MADAADPGNLRPGLAPPHTPVQPLRPFLEFLVPGHTLTPADVAEITEGLARRDAWIEHCREQEGAVSEPVEDRSGFLQEVLRSLRAPLLGYGMQDGELTGMYHDRWAGPQLSMSIQPRRPVFGIALRGWVPDDMPSGGQLIVRAGDAVAETELEPGRFTLSVGIPGGTEASIPLTVEATRWVTPEGPDGRTLAFILREIELEHRG
jgi:hypothetical protein